MYLTAAIILLIASIILPIIFFLARKHKGKTTSIKDRFLRLTCLLALPTSVCCLIGSLYYNHTAALYVGKSILALTVLGACLFLLRGFYLAFIRPAIQYVWTGKPDWKPLAKLDSWFVRYHLQ